MQAPAIHKVATLYHSADTTPDHAISLSELLRVVQFYSLGGLRCDESLLSEDGFLPGETGSEGCTPHHSDYAPQNWTITLGELLRLIQLYNAGAYHVACGIEDGFAPGAGEHAPCDPEGEEEGEDADVRLWSDPEIWGGDKPEAGESVIVPEDWYLLLDEDTPALAGLTIQGTLEFSREDLNLTADWILVEGTLRVGAPDDPFTHEAVITLTGDDPEESIMEMGTRGILVMGGAIELFGLPPVVGWTKINAHAETGTSALQLMEGVDWNPGDEIIIAPTTYYNAYGGASVTQQTTLASINGSELTLADALLAPRWGLLQYVTQDGMSLSPDNRVTPPVPDTETEVTPTVLDQRAEVGDLTRNIVIQAPDDTLWQDQGFGVHVMVMGPESSAHVDGVEFRRGGQRHRLGRYPFHWHMLSYDGDQTLPDATGQYLRNSVVNRSMNRGIVIHGTNGVLVQNNIVYDVRGHGVFLEDAVERRNTIDGNLVLHVRNPDPGYALMQHEAGGGNNGSSGFWIANPDNIITNNTAADAHHGFWLAFPARPWGLSSDVPMIPNRTRFGVFDGNTTHTNVLEGLMLDRPQIDVDGNTFDTQYQATSDGANPVWPFENLERFTLSRFTTWKNGLGGIWDRATLPNNWEIVSADNCQRFFAGSGADGLIERCLVVGTSLNSAPGDPRPGWAGDPTPSAFATYHSTFDIVNNIIVNFPVEPGTRSGAFATDDYYSRPVDKGQVRNENNLLLQSHPGYKLAAHEHPNMGGVAPGDAWFTLAGALWDPHGNWGPGGDNSYFVYDVPFLTHGTTTTPVEAAGESGGIIAEGPYYGVSEFVVNNGNETWDDLMAIEVTRFDAGMSAIAEWDVPQAFPGQLLAHMRDFAAHPTGRYLIEFPGFGPETTPVTDASVLLEGLLTEDDSLVVGIEFSGAVTPNNVYVISFQHYTLYEEVGSLEAVIASPGETWWQDTDNNRVWAKARGGRWQWWTTDPNEPGPTPDDYLYMPVTLHVNTD